MTIGIDVSMLNYQGSGVANYNFNLVKNLLKYDKKNEYRLFYSSLRRPKNFHYLEDLKKLGGKVYDFNLPMSLMRKVWGKAHIIPVEWFIGKVDVFLSSDFLRPPLLKGTRGATTVHDLTWKIFPQFHTEDVIDAHTKKLEKTVKYRDLVLADSLNTKKDILKHYPQIKEKNVRVIYPAIGEQFKRISNQKVIKKALKKYGIKYPSGFLLYTGAIEPRKNLEQAIKVFNEFIKEKKYRDYRFLIVGRAGWKNENIFSFIKNLGLEKKVKFIGYVEDQDLPNFYSAAKVFVYLSKYEGFGLPPLEAAACGTPTLLYSNSSLSEIFKPGYPYTKKGKELETLKKLIDKKPDIKKFRYNFSWRTYVKEFVKIISS